MNMLGKAIISLNLVWFVFMIVHISIALALLNFKKNHNSDINLNNLLNEDIPQPTS